MSDDLEYRMDVAVWRALTAAGIDAPQPAAPTVEPLAFPANVAPGELIESSWGNAVVETLGKHELYSHGYRGHVASSVPFLGVTTAWIAITGMRVDWMQGAGRYYLVQTHVDFTKPDVASYIETQVSLGTGGAIGHNRSYIQGPGGALSVTTIGLFQAATTAPNFVQLNATCTAGWAEAYDRLITVVDLGNVPLP
jgi:hypothetical protein